jgi:hypothetical protein
MFPCLEIPTRNVSQGPWRKTFDPSLTLSEVAQFKTVGDQQGVNKGNYHNPTRQ